MSSQPPNFGDFQPNQPSYNPSPYAAPQQGFRDPYGPPPPKASGGMPWWLWLILGAFLGGGLLCCGSCGGLAYFGMEVSAQEVSESLQGNPVIEEHIGEVTDFSYNFGSTVSDEQDTENTVFDIEGTKGKGKVVGELNDDSSALINGVLKTDTGTYDLFPTEE